MEIPEPLRELVDQLGQALVQALAVDPASRALARKIQAEGYDVALMLEATVALHKRDPEAGEEDEAGGDAEGWPTPESLRLSSDREKPEGLWSEEDKAFLRTFKISLD